MKRKHVGFDARVSPAMAADPAPQGAAPGSATTDGWVSQGREQETAFLREAAADRVAGSILDEPALRIARLMPFWLGFYLFVGAMTQILRPAR